MLPPRTRPDLVVELELEKLREPSYYEILFFSQSNTDNHCFPDTIIRVRPLDTAKGVFEIVTGVEQFRTARQQGTRTIPALIKDMTQQEARRYATNDLLRTASLSATRSTVQLIVAAKDNEAQGGDWSVERFTKQLGIKRSTYTHAWSSVQYVCDELRKSNPEAADLGLAELIALALRKDFMPAFTALYTGRLAIDKFYREQYGASEVARARSEQQREAKARSKAEKQTGPTQVANKEVTPTHAPPLSTLHPKQLIAEGAVRFAQASAIRKSEAGAEAENAQQQTEQQLIELLDSYTDLEHEIQQFCRFVLNHFADRARRQRSTRKSARASHLNRPTENTQLSFELQEPAPLPETNVSGDSRDGEVQAA